MPSNPYSLAHAKNGKPLFVPFTVLGDPNVSESLTIVRTLIESGADALELGFPFSDPPADGPVIQAADVRALKAGIRVDDCFAMLKKIRIFTTIPIGLLVYYNLILQRGVDQFYRECRESGVDSVLVADLPLEHAEEVLASAKAHGIAPVFIVSEATIDERLKKIAAVAQGYLYVVSYLGVTGVSDALKTQNIQKTIQRIRVHTDLPLMIGFGIHTPADVAAAVLSGADGVIVGSRIVAEIPDCARVAAVTRQLRTGIHPLQ